MCLMLMHIENTQKARNDMSWAYERLDELVESGEMSEEEARKDYREWIKEQIIKESEDE